jgi:hypothetical protein
MFKVGLVTFQSGVIPAKDFSTKSEADEYILIMAEKEGIKTGYIENLETGEREKLEELK